MEKFIKVEKNLYLNNYSVDISASNGNTNHLTKNNKNLDLETKINLVKSLNAEK